MPKASAKTVYVCQSCGAVHAKWAGRCSSCGEWNTLTEEIAETKGAKKQIKGRQAKISDRSLVWLIDEPSLKRFLKTERKVGRPKKT